MHHTLIAILRLVSAFVTSVAHAHEATDNYFTLNVDREKSQANGTSSYVISISCAIWTGMSTRRSTGEKSARGTRHLAFRDGGPVSAACTLTVAEHIVDHHTDGVFAIMKLTGSRPSAASTL